VTSPALTISRIRRVLPAVFVGAVFTWVLFLPVSHNELLYPLFGLLGLVAVIAVLRRDPDIDIRLWVVAFLVAFLGVYGNLLGNQNPDPIFTLTVFLAAPAMYLAGAAAVTTTTLRGFMVAAVIGTVMVSGVLLVFIGGEAGVIPQIVPNWVVTQLDLRATFRDGGSQARSWGLSSLASLGPIWVASLLVRRHPLLPPWGVRLACAALAVATAVLSARTAILLVILLAPVVALLLKVTLFRTTSARIRRPRHPAVWIGIAAAAVIAAIAVIPRLATFGPVASILVAVGSFFGVADGSGDSDQSIRSDQAWYLLQGWMQDPIFGSGFRAAVPGYDRASEIPWSLELQYHVLLFNVGVLGVTIAIAAVCAGLLLVRKAVVMRADFAPLLVVTATGAVGMLIANATNPYLAAPGHQWAIFLPLAVAILALSGASENHSADVLSTAPEPSRERRDSIVW
jgi:hypothetical protein